MNRRETFRGVVTGILVATGVCLIGTALAQEPSESQVRRRIGAPHTIVKPPTDADARIAPFTVVTESYSSTRWEKMVLMYDCAVNLVKAQGYTEDDEYWSSRVISAYAGIELGKIECEIDDTEEAAEVEEE